MFYVIETDGTIIDAATRQQNITANYKIQGRELLQADEIKGGMVGDHIQGGKLVKNMTVRNATKRTCLENQLMREHLRLNAARDLNLTDRIVEKQSIVSTLTAELASLSSQ